MAKLVSAYFSSNSNWVCPAGVTRVYLLGHGGGAGGSGGRNATNDVANGGNSTTPYMVAVDVVPNTTYSINIGTGGTAGTARTSATQNGGTGGNTTFGALHTFLGAPIVNNNPDYLGPLNSQVGIGQTSMVFSAVTNVSSGYVARTLQSSGTVSGSYFGGKQGAPGYFGSTGGTPGNGNNAGAGTAAVAGTGFGAGGSGGGAGTTGSAGAAGRPGQLWVMWVE